MLDIIPPNEKNCLSDLESTFPIDVAQSHLYGTNPRDHPEWNPANEKNKTEKYFMEVFQSYRSGNDAEKDLDFYLTNEKDRKKFSPGASKVLGENFEQLMRGILNQRKHRNNNYLNPYLLRIIPKLAAFNPEQFEKIALRLVFKNFYWWRAPSSQCQFENSPKKHIFKTYTLNIDGWVS